MSRFVRARSQVLHRYLPGALFVHPVYGVCMVSAVDLDPAVHLNQRALFEALRDYLFHWDPPLRDGFPLESAASNPARFFLVGVPTRAWFVPYPEQVACQVCGRVTTMDVVLRQDASGHCPTCGGALRQVRFVEAHFCGSITPLPVPRCRIHGDAHIRLATTGRYRTLSWRCVACGDAYVAGPRNRACHCIYSRRLPEESAERLWRGVMVLDPGLHLVHSFAFLNLPADHLDSILADPDGRVLSLARSCGALSQSVAEVVRQRQASSTPADQTALETFVSRLEQSGLDTAFLHAQLAAAQQVQSRTATDALDALNTRFGDLATLTGRLPRRVVEYAALLDASGARTLDGLRDDLSTIGDQEGVATLEAGARTATALGLQQLRALDAFPLAICAPGFSRLTREPQGCVVVPFRLPNDQRIPLYVLTNTTEAVLLQLDPVRVLAWLARNDLIAIDVPTSTLDAWAALYQAVPGLLDTRFQAGYDSPVAIIVRTLLHTVSHALLGTIEGSGYDPASVGEFLFPEVLACVLYANRFQENKLGGLLTLIERGLDAWLNQAQAAVQTCLYDPLCSDGGGACVGCLHREHGCAALNRELSRAVLVGGVLPPEETRIDVPPLTTGYWDTWITPGSVPG